jgi:PKD repeat protein
MCGRTDKRGLLFSFLLSVLLLQIAACENKENSAPVAAFIYNPASGDAPLAVSFDASGSFDSDGSISTYQWAFGDGTTGSGVTASHTFSSSGSYTVTLTVTDDKNSTATTTGIVKVSSTLSARIAAHSYPKLANQIQDYTPSSVFLQDAAYYDLLVLDAELVQNNPSDLGPFGTLRSVNPNLVIVLYFSAGDIIPGNTATINAGFISGLQDNWYMKDTSGNKVKLFELTPGFWTEMLNLTTGLNSYLPSYLNTNVLADGLTDGIFYDWINDEIHWLNYRTNSPSGPLDINNDSIKESDAQLNSLWRQGTITLLQNSRSTFPSNSIIIGNGG